MNNKKTLISALVAIMLFTLTNCTANAQNTDENLSANEISAIDSAYVDSISEEIDLDVASDETISETGSESVDIASEIPDVVINGNATVNVNANEFKSDAEISGTYTKYINSAIMESMTKTYFDKTMMTKSQRDAIKDINKTAAADWDYTMTPVLGQTDSSTLYVRPFAMFESVDMKYTNDVSNVGYGMYVGGDSELYELGNGWDAMFGGYVGYYGSHQAWAGNSVYQNGGTGGVEFTVFKGNFFNTIIASTGATGGRNEWSRGGVDHFSIFNAGVADRFGYNIELASGKFVIQPNFLVSYTFVKDFTSHITGSRTHQNLHAVGLEPGIKFIGNLDNGWQPYASVSVVCNILNKKSHFTPYNASLPELANKPFVRYGVGLKKSWGEKFSGFFQAHVTNGGRTGVGLQAGLRWIFGK